MISKESISFSNQSFPLSVYIGAAKRTPIGSFLGKLSQFSATDLGGFAVKGAIQSINLDPKQIDEVILGNVVSAGLGQAPARQASIKGNVPINVPCTTINKVCSSGMKTIMLGAQSISLGQNHTVVVGGFQSMSNAPYYVTNHRKGHSFGNHTLIDAVAHDGLTDAFNHIAMGKCAQKTVDDFQMSRQLQDEFAIISYNRTIQSIKKGRFVNQIIPIKISQKQILSQDQEHKRYNKQKLLSLKSAFKLNGSVTAGNSSKLNDGACALILFSEEKIKKLNIKPLAKIITYADAELEPIDFCIAPKLAANKALERAKMSIEQIDFFQFNEAFAATVLANMELLKIPIQKMNVNGGAVSLGHPIGMSGARIVQSLISVLIQNKARFGLAAICNGGGGASAIIIENLIL